MIFSISYRHELLVIDSKIKSWRRKNKEISSRTTLLTYKHYIEQHITKLPKLHYICDTIIYSKYVCMHTSIWPLHKRVHVGSTCIEYFMLKYIQYKLLHELFLCNGYINSQNLSKSTTRENNICLSKTMNKTTRPTTWCTSLNLLNLFLKRNSFVGQDRYKGQGHINIVQNVG